MSKHDFEFVRHLVNSEEEFMAIFKDEEDIETLLGIEYAYVDGTFQSDFTFDGTNEDNEDQDVGDVYRKEEYAYFPESYPCLVLFLNYEDYDRNGKVQIRDLEFVYSHEFKESEEVKAAKILFSR